ncbi:MAG: hypothetical protein H6636_02055 [Anaerolineales bacterium]|nr:hypothetical protein [Anaerolineales bacterium]
MPYRFVTEKEDYSDFASGCVFYNAPGHPAFPVRLVDEIFQRCLALRGGETSPVHLYDPCCGAAYHLAVLGYLHSRRIASLTASDVDTAILEVARRNLSLLTPSGLVQRQIELETMATQFGKESHVAALASVERFRGRWKERSSSFPMHLFRADATHSHEIAAQLPVQPVDVVLSDVPYDQHSAWQLHETLHASPSPPLWHLLDALIPFLSPQSVVAIAADKGQKIQHEAYRRAERFQVGKRQIALLQLL